MKQMSDRKMDMNKGAVKSGAFLPEEPHHKPLAKVGAISDHKYPDTQEEVHRDQQGFVKDTNKAKARPDYRH